MKSCNVVFFSQKKINKNFSFENIIIIKEA